MTTTKKDKTFSLRSRKVATLATLALSAESGSAAVTAISFPSGVTAATNLASNNGAAITALNNWNIDGVGDSEFGVDTVNIDGSVLLYALTSPNSNASILINNIPSTRPATVSAGTVIGATPPTGLSYRALTGTVDSTNGIFYSASSSVLAGNPLAFLAIGGTPILTATSDVDAFMGFSFSKGADTHYGYLHFRADFINGGEITKLNLLGGAYESTAGASIAVPEPSSVALLAMGVAGIAGYRKRKEQ